MKLNSFLTRKIVFPDEQTKKEFDGLLADLTKDHPPVGRDEGTQVEIMGLSLWRLRDLYAWEFVEISRRGNASEAAMLATIAASGGDREAAVREAAEQGWQIRELTCRAGTRGREDECGLPGDMTDKMDNVVVEAKLADGMNLVLRYKNAALRDYYRALSVLLTVQRERLELNGEVTDEDEQE